MVLLCVSFKNLGRSILHSNSDTHSFFFVKGKCLLQMLTFCCWCPPPAISPCTSCSPMFFVIRGRPVYSVSLFSSCFTLQVLHLNNYWSETNCIVGWLNRRNYLFISFLFSSLYFPGKVDGLLFEFIRISAFFGDRLQLNT